MGNSKPVLYQSNDDASLLSAKELHGPVYGDRKVDQIFDFTQLHLINGS
jgi:hypothetical protein